MSNKDQAEYKWLCGENAKGKEVVVLFLHGAKLISDEGKQFLGENRMYT